MRVFALSDVHIDYPENKRWLSKMSHWDYQDDWLLLAGDISDRLSLLAQCFNIVQRNFAKVLFVPGNHDLWIKREPFATSIDKYHAVLALAQEHGLDCQQISNERLSCVAIHGWYDYSFGQPSEQLKTAWVDYRACRWPEGYTEQTICDYFLTQNLAPIANRDPKHTVITCSHFLPRIDVMPNFIPHKHRIVYPVLGSIKIDAALRQHNPSIHVYGHSHVNVDTTIGGVRYLNNAFAYPQEKRIARKRLKCIYRG